MLLRGSGSDSSAAHALQELELIASVDKYGAGGFASADTQHEFAHALQAPNEGGIVAVAGYDAERVNERVGERNFKSVHNKLDIGVILLRDAIAQGRHNGEGIAEQQLFKVREAVGIAVDLAQQNIAADFDLFEDRVEGRHFRAAVFEVNKYCKFCHGDNSPIAAVGSVL